MQPADHGDHDQLDRRTRRSAQHQTGALRGRSGRAERPHQQRLLGRPVVAQAVGGYGPRLLAVGRSGSLHDGHRQPRLHLHAHGRPPHPYRRIFPRRQEPPQPADAQPVRSGRTGQSRRRERRLRAAEPRRDRLPLPQPRIRTPRHGDRLGAPHRGAGRVPQSPRSADDALLPQRRERTHRGCASPVTSR